MKRSVLGILAALIIGVIAGPYLRQAYEKFTTPAPDRLVLKAVTFTDLPGWTDDGLGDFAPAMLGSCEVIRRQPPERQLGPDPRMGTVADWLEPCAAIAQQSSAPGFSGKRERDYRDYIERLFRPFQVLNNARQSGKFTGYYEPELRGSLTRQGAYQVALLRPPAGLVSVNLGEFNPAWRGQRTAGRVSGGALKPLPPRTAIEAGALAEEKLELLYTDDPIDAFFLHIQGSGRVRLDDGRVIRLGYAGQNGHSYVAIGKNLVQSGAIRREDISMQSIRGWLDAHPTERDAVLNANPSYVFFRELAGGDPTLGPPGAQNVPLTPGRSLAVDPDFHALGVPVWLDSVTPGGEALQRLMVAQDTGGAIRGPVRGDMFWGFGPDAAKNAGRMNSEGRMYILLPQAIADKAAAQKE